MTLSRLYRWFGGVCLAGLFSGVAWAQTTEPKLPDTFNSTDNIRVEIDGQSVGLGGNASHSLPLSAARFTVSLNSEHGGRKRYRLDEVDKNWLEDLSDASFSLRFLDAKGDQINQHSFRIVGQTAGWNGDLQNPVFVHRKETVIAPARAGSFWVVISSAGPPGTVGTILVDDVVVSRVSAGAGIETLLRAPEGRETQNSGPPAPKGFCVDGTMPSMAELLRLFSPPAGKPRQCFAIIDDDNSAHAEWHTLKKDAPAVAPGDQLLVEWNEAYSIGCGGRVQAHYDRPPAGAYRFHVQSIDLLGRPVGEESSFTLDVPAPYWQRPWVWACAVASFVAIGFFVGRYISGRRMREQLMHLKEERLLEQERMRIAREIHDTLAQGFTGIIVQLEAAEDAQARGLTQDNATHLKRASELARESLREARRSVLALRPHALNGKGLPDALTELLEKRTTGTPLRAELRLEGTSRKLPPDIEQNLMRIALEGLTNTLRYAHARRFTAHLIFTEESLRLDLNDDGSGFNPAAGHEGFGLTGMEERAEAMAGNFSVRSAPGEGTSISIVLPAHRAYTTPQTS